MHHVAPKMKQIYRSGATFLLNMLHIFVAKYRWLAHLASIPNSLQHIVYLSGHIDFNLLETEIWFCSKKGG
jgi:hypothetical protein